MTTLTFGIQFPKFQLDRQERGPIPRRAPSQLLKFPPSEPMDAACHTTGIWSEGDTEYIGCDPQKQTRTAIDFAKNTSLGRSDLRGNYIESVCRSSKQIYRKETVNFEN